LLLVLRGLGGSNRKELLLTSLAPPESESLPLVVLPSTLPLPVIIDILLYLLKALSKREAVEVGLSVRVRIFLPVGGNLSCLSPLWATWLVSSSSSEIVTLFYLLNSSSSC